jgi:perosamine synthetase
MSTDRERPVASAREPFLSVCRPFLGGRELEYVTACLRAGWISSSGPHVREFEERFAAYLGVKHAVAVTSGTAALHVACAALGLGPGDEVVMPTFTMIAPAFAVCYTGATPVFCDSVPESWVLDPARIEEQITPRTRAILAVHIYGHPCDMDAVRSVARRRGLALIEDAAEAIGSQVRGAPCGRLGDVGCFSFFANKAITCGEGGMVVTDSDELARSCRSLRNLAFPVSTLRTFHHERIAFNYRMPSLSAALGLAQLERIDEYVAMRRRNAARYGALLAGVTGITLPPEADWARNSYWMYAILVDERFGESRDALMERLAGAGIETRPFFVPLHRQEALRVFGCECDTRHPVAEMLGERGLYLPSSTDLTEAEIERVCRTLLRGRA